MILFKTGFLAMMVVVIGCSCTAIPPGAPADRLPERSSGSAPNVGESAGPQLQYQTTSVYDPETKIKQITLDTQGLELSVSFSYPVFDESTQGYQEINSYFEELADRFFSRANDTLTHIWDAAAHKDDRNQYYYNQSVKPMTHTNEIVSLLMVYEWWSGGVGEEGYDSYTFSTETGGLLSIHDFVAETDEEIRAFIILQLQQLEEEKDGEIFDLEYIRTCAISDLKFTIEAERIVIYFSQYEIAPGAYGTVALPLPMDLVHSK